MRVSLILIASCLAGCPGSDPQPLVFLSRAPYTGTVTAIGGGGNSDLMAYGMSGFDDTVVRLLSFDSARPDQLSLLAELSLGPGHLVRHIAASSEAVAIGFDSSVLLVDASAPGTPAATIGFGEAVTDCALSGRWVLAVSGSDLVAVNRDAPNAPALFTPASRPTALVGTAGTFLAFTTTGYVVVALDTGTPSFREVSHPDLRNIRGAFTTPAGAIVAGPTTALGTSRVLRLDLTTPASPVITARHEVEGAYGGFAWDGGDLSFVAISGPSGDVHEGYLLRERQGFFEASGVPLPMWFEKGVNPLVARTSHVIALGFEGAGYFRVP